MFVDFYNTDPKIQDFHVLFSLLNIVFVYFEYYNQYILYYF